MLEALLEKMDKSSIIQYNRSIPLLIGMERVSTIARHRT